MGWFWADASPAAPGTVCRGPASSASIPPGCPMHAKPRNALPPACPISHGAPDAPPQEPPSLFSRLNPLNNMPRDLSQERAPGQTHALPTSRDPSTIPRGAPGEGNWEYPSPQQMYNALLRKGYADTTDVTAVESMVGVHNFLNEGAWVEIAGWERRFRGGLAKGWKICERGEENADATERRLRDGTEVEPRLVRFQGRPGEMTPKATMLQVLGWLYPAKYGTEPPFDRHDWYVSRTTPDGQSAEVRYVIDYYSGPPEPTGEPVFYLDVRPAATLTGATERVIRWAGNTWWRASGGEARERDGPDVSRESNPRVS